MKNEKQQKRLQLEIKKSKSEHIPFYKEYSLRSHILSLASGE